MKALYVLVFEVLNKALHVVQVSLQLHFVVAKAVELSAQICDVGLEHGVDVGACGRLVLKKAPFCLQHLVLLLQETHLHWKDENRGFVSIKTQMKTTYLAVSAASESNAPRPMLQSNFEIMVLRQLAKV